jgi:hypothetical protein
MDHAALLPVWLEATIPPSFLASLGPLKQVADLRSPYQT